jgi:hypothetical protein
VNASSYCELKWRRNRQAGDDSRLVSELCGLGAVKIARGVVHLQESFHETVDVRIGGPSRFFSQFADILAVDTPGFPEKGGIELCAARIGQTVEPLFVFPSMPAGMTISFILARSRSAPL